MADITRIHPDLYKLITKFTACDDGIDGDGSHCESDYFHHVHPFVRSQSGLSDNWKIAFNFWITLNGVREEKLHEVTNVDTAASPEIDLTVKLLLAQNSGSTTNIEEPTPSTDAQNFLNALKAIKHPLQKPIQDCVQKEKGGQEPLDECFASILVDSGRVQKTTARERYKKLQDPNSNLEDRSDFSLMNARTASNHADLLVFFGMVALAYPAEKNPFK